MDPVVRYRHLRNWVRTFGIVGTVVLLTLISTLASLLIVLAYEQIFGIQVGRNTWTLSFVCPVIIAPLVSFHLLSLLVHLDNAERRATDLMRYDSLTRCLNRATLIDIVAQEIERAARYGHPFSIVMMDADDFKRINDSQGHLVGDQVLKRITQVASDVIRRPDSIARFGGEEFLILLPDTNLRQARETAERIRKSIEICGIPEPNIRVTVSLGVTTLRGSDDDFESLFNRADVAMLQAKRAGKNKVVTNPGIDPKIDPRDENGRYGQV